jgi:outer membrane protein assembly factor BamB
MKKLTNIFVIIIFLLSSTGTTKSSMPNVILLWEKFADLDESHQLPMIHGDNLYIFRPLFDNGEISYMKLLYSSDKFTGKRFWRNCIEWQRGYYNPIFYKNKIILYSSELSKASVECIPNDPSYFGNHSFGLFDWVIKLDTYLEELPNSLLSCQVFEDTVFLIVGKTLLEIEIESGKIIKEQKLNYGDNFGAWAKIRLVDSKHVFISIKINANYDRDILVCIDKTTFKEIWRYGEKIAMLRLINLSKINNSIILTGNFMKVINNKEECEDRIMFIDPATGKYTILATKSRISENIYFDDNNAIISCADSCDTDYAVECIDLKTETTRWKYDEPEVDDRIIPSNNPKGIIIASKEFTNKEPEKIQKILRLDSETGKKLWEEVIPDNSRFNKLFLDEDRIYYQDDDFIKCYLVLGL